METGSAGYSQQSFTKAFPFNLSSLNIKLSLIVVTILAIYHWRRRKLYALSWKLEGPPALPIIGNAYVFLASMDVIFKSMNKMHNKYRDLRQPEHSPLAGVSKNHRARISF
uniref:Cytochrome P450 n=1 Tax=Cacopsylla melanoneura TaxID=428564 RepID=A0A8D8WR83_9HEMI